MTYKSDFLNEIESRGFIYQSSEIEDLDNLMSKKNITAYIGFDITSDSLHIGSLVQLMLLHWLDYFGHKTIALHYPSAATYLLLKAKNTIELVN